MNKWNGVTNLIVYMLHVMTDTTRNCMYHTFIKKKKKTTWLHFKYDYSISFYFLNSNEIILRFIFWVGGGGFRRIEGKFDLEWKH